VREPAGVSGDTTPPDEPQQYKRRFAGIKLGDVAQAFTILGGLAYGFGWVLTSRFYGTLGVSSEDVGISPAWLAIRTLVFVFVVVAVGGLGVILIGKARPQAPTLWVISTRVGVILLICLLTLIPVGVACFGLLLWAHYQLPRPALTIPFVVLIGVWVVILGITLRLGGFKEPISFA
jgi:hypothetical protein